MWSVLSKVGNSNTDERIALMKRYLALFDAKTIKLLLADREFIGLKLMAFLNENNVFCHQGQRKSDNSNRGRTDHGAEIALAQGPW